LAPLRDGRTLASGSYDKTIRFWDLETGEEIFVIHLQFPIISLALINKDLLCVGDDTGGIWLWQLHQEEEIFKSELLWTTCYALNCSGINLSQIVGLSEANKKLMLQQGATS